MKTNKWDVRFLNLADHISLWSKDKSRKVGAVLVKDKRVISMGYNGFPVGCDDDNPERHERPAKYDWVVHAEENAIANAARHGASVYGSIMYTNLFPCCRCAGNIINSGVKKIVCSKHPNFEDEKYGNEFKLSWEKFVEADVDIEIIPTAMFMVDVNKLDIENMTVDEVKNKIKDYIDNTPFQFVNKNDDESYPKIDRVEYDD